MQTFNNNTLKQRHENRAKARAIKRARENKLPQRFTRCWPKVEPSRAESSRVAKGRYDSCRLSNSKVKYKLCDKDTRPRPDTLLLGHRLRSSPSTPFFFFAQNAAMQSNSDPVQMKTKLQQQQQQQLLRAGKGEEQGQQQQQQQQELKTWPNKALNTLE